MPSGTMPLKVLQHLAGVFGQRADYGQRAAEVRTSFERLFWCEKRGYLCDVVAPEGPDWAIRPNQIFALSLPFPLIEGERARRILSVIDEHLLTPRGLRRPLAARPGVLRPVCGRPLETRPCVSPRYGVGDGSLARTPLPSAVVTAARAASALVPF